MISPEESRERNGPGLTRYLEDARPVTEVGRWRTWNSGITEHFGVISHQGVNAWRVDESVQSE